MTSSTEAQWIQRCMRLRADTPAPVDLARLMGVQFPSDATCVADALERAGISVEQFAALMCTTPWEIRQAMRTGEFKVPFDRYWARLAPGVPVKAPKEATWRERLPGLKAQGLTPAQILDALGCPPSDAPTLQAALQQRGVSQALLAELLDVHAPQVGHWLAKLPQKHLPALRALFPGLPAPARKVPTLLAQRILDKGLTQQAVAQALGCTPPLVNHWCTGRSTPSARMQKRLDELLGEGTAQPSDMDLLLEWLDSKGLLAEAVAYMQERR